MDDVTAVAPAVATGQIPKCCKNVLILTSLACPCPAPVFINSHQSNKRHKEESDDGKYVPRIGCKDDRCYDHSSKGWFPDGAAKCLDCGLSPCRKRSNAHQQHQRRK